MGIEPISPAWKAGALPLSYTRKALGTMMAPKGRFHSIPQGFLQMKLLGMQLSKQSNPFARRQTPSAPHERRLFPLDGRLRHGRNFVAFW